jgi:hypothetical protein
LVISIVVLFVDFRIAGPYFARGYKYEGLTYLSNLGTTWGEVFAGLLSPKLFSALTQPENGPYVIALFQPSLWFLPLLTREILFVIPDLGVNLLAGNNGMKVIAWHYNCLTGAFLVLSNTFAIPRVEQWLSRRRIAVRLCPVLPALLAVFALAHWPFWFVPAQYRPLPQYEAQRQARALIPPDASLLVSPVWLIGQFSCRMRFSSHSQLRDDPKLMFEYDWAYFDMNPVYYDRVPAATLDAFRNNPDYQCVFADKGILLFRRKEN